MRSATCIEKNHSWVLNVCPGLAPARASSQRHTGTKKACIELTIGSNPGSQPHLLPMVQRPSLAMRHRPVFEQGAFPPQVGIATPQAARLGRAQPKNKQKAVPDMAFAPRPGRWDDKSKGDIQIAYYGRGFSTFFVSSFV